MKTREEIERQRALNERAREAIRRRVRAGTVSMTDAVNQFDRIDREAQEIADELAVLLQGEREHAARVCSDVHDPPDGKA